MAELSAYHPTLRDRLGNVVYDVFGSFAPSIANRARDEAQFLADFLPGVGDALAVDDTVQAARAGNWGDAAIFGSLAAIGAAPGVGDLAAKAIKDFPYHRFTQGAHPDSGIGYMMFAHGDPDRVRHYGANHWVVDPDDLPPGSVIDATDPDIQAEFAEMLRDNWDEVEKLGYGYNAADELASELAPENIVDSAALWDSDLVNLAWEQFLEPRGVLGVRTPDGFIAFDPSHVRKAPVSGGF